MQLPTTAQIRTAIEALRQFGEHINHGTANALIQLPNHNIPVNTAHTSKRGQSDKSFDLRPSRRNWQSGATNWRESRGNVLFNAFETGQALLLSSLRFLRPRSSRGEDAGQPPNIIDSWPQLRQFRECRHAHHRARTPTARVHEKSVSVFCPRHQTRRQTVRIRELAVASMVRKQAFARNARYPQIVHSLEPSTNAILWYEAFSKKDPTILDKILHETWVDIPSPPGTPAGPEGVKPLLAQLTTTFPDLTLAIEDILQEGNKVVVRARMAGTQKEAFMGFPSKNRKMDIQVVDIHEFKDGKIVRTWHTEDWMSGLRQLAVFEK